MKLLAQLYATLNKTYSAKRFNQLYRLQVDPFETLSSGSERHKQAVILELVSQRTYQHALDIGCGLGHLTARLGPYCQSVLGIDFSSEAIAQARHHYPEHANVHFQAMDIRQFQATQRYDLLVCSEVLYYLDLTDLEMVMQRLVDVAMPGAHLILVGRADDRYVTPKVNKYFSLIEHREGFTEARPFGVLLFKVN